MVQAQEYLATTYKILRVNWLARVRDTQAMKHSQISINRQSISEDVNNQGFRANGDHLLVKQLVHVTAQKQTITTVITQR